MNNVHKIFQKKKKEIIFLNKIKLNEIKIF